MGSAISTSAVTSLICVIIVYQLIFLNLASCLDAPYVTPGSEDPWYQEVDRKIYTNLYHKEL
jgi:hypothetical protein